MKLIGEKEYLEQTIKEYRLIIIQAKENESPEAYEKVLKVYQPSIDFLLNELKDKYNTIL